MAWGDGKGGWQGGPWGSPPGGGRPPGNGQPPRRPPPGGGPDLDELFRRGRERFKERFPGDGDGNGNNKRIGIILAGVGLLLWALSGIYLVRADEQGVVMRFGKLNRTASSGINYHLPYPFEMVYKPKVTVVNRVEIGFRSGGMRSNAKGETSIPEESLMLTGDENIVDINFEVQWIISDAAKYLFNIRNPKETVKAVSESAMREIIGHTPISTVLAPGREKVEISTKKLIQDTLDNYRAGIEIITVNLRDVNPPAQALDAFRDVQSARADKDTEQNKAMAYRNDIIPRARGQVEQIIQDAEAYKQEVVARARGEASRFLAVYTEYKQAKDVTRQRMYLETMEEILQGMNKVVMDKSAAGSVVPYLPLPAVKSAAEAGRP